MSGSGSFGLPPPKTGSPPRFKFGVNYVEERRESEMDIDAPAAMATPRISSSTPSVAASATTSTGGFKKLSVSESMMYSQKPLNALLGAPAVPQTFTDFIFPDEHGNAEDSVIDDDTLDQIRALACRSNPKTTTPASSFQSATQVTQGLASQGSQDIIPASQQQLSMLMSSASLTSQSTTSSTQSSARSLGSTGSQGFPNVVRPPHKSAPTWEAREIAYLEEQERKIERKLAEKKLKSKTMSGQSPDPVTSLSSSLSSDDSQDGVGTRIVCIAFKHVHTTVQR